MQAFTVSSIRFFLNIAYQSKFLQIFKKLPTAELFGIIYPKIFFV